MQTLGPITRTTATGIAADPAVLRAAFSDVLVQDGTASDPIALGGSSNHSVVIRVAAHTPEQALPLDKAREQVIAAIRADRQRQAGDKAADALLAKLKAGATLQSLAASEKLQLSPMPGLPRSQPVPTPEINRAIFSAPLPAEGKPSYGKVDVNGHALVFAVNKVNPGDIKEVTAEQQKQLKDQLSQIDGMAAAKAYIEAMRKKYRGEAEKAAKDFALAEKKTEVTWSGPRAIIAKNRVKLLLNLFLVAYGAIPRGGSLDISLENPETDAKFKIVAKGRMLRVPPKYQEILSGHLEEAVFFFLEVVLHLLRKFLGQRQPAGARRVGLFQRLQQFIELVVL